MDKAEKLFEKLRKANVLAFLIKHPDMEPVVRVKSKLRPGLLSGKVPVRPPKP